MENALNGCPQSMHWVIAGHGVVTFIVFNFKTSVVITSRAEQRRHT